MITAETYTERVCLITVWNAQSIDEKTDYVKSNASLSLFVFGKSSNDLPQSIFDARDQGQSLPTSSSEQERVLWTWTITSNKITELYSEKLAVVQNYRTFNVLTALDGNLLRSIACSSHTKLTPIFKSLCAMRDEEHCQCWLVDMHNGRIYEPPACLTSEQTEKDNENRPQGFIK
ncbi:hypothetical protein BDF19DRAFT_488051 [Syncephalis fuscata]|nr:hypothetical protein BDF19DRAFT_488051 [Syncephalis fuscata]